MSSVVISGDTSGTVTVTVPAVAGTQTATLPAATGTVMVSGNMPAFSAYASSNTNVSANTWTKIAFQTKEFDTNTNYDAVTNYRFTPTVAGYYNFISCVQLNNGIGATQFLVSFYQNGVIAKRIVKGDSNTLFGIPVTALIYCNGTTDYVEVYANVAYTSGTLASNAGASVTYFQGYLVRTA